MKVLVDMNLSPRWVAEFQSRGFEATHWSAIGAATAPDEEVLAWCAVHGHVLLTHDLDFGAILAGSKGQRPSVMQLRTENVLPDAMAQRVTETLSLLANELEQGALVTVDPARHRIRFLPLTGD